MPDAGDPKIYLAGAVAIVAEYPTAVMAALADPRSGTRVLKDYPSLSALRRACEALHEPIEREEEHAEAERRIAGTLAQIPRLPRTVEQQAAVDAAVARARRSLGIPSGGLPPRGMQALAPSEIPPARRHALLAELEVRKARNAEDVRFVLAPPEQAPAPAVRPKAANG